MGKKKHNEKLDVEQVAQALREHYGNVLCTARHLGVQRGTVYNYIKKYKTCEKALKQGREHLVDLAESKIVEKVKAGEWPAIKEVLSKLGKARGWGDSVDHKHSGEVGVKHSLGWDTPPKK